MPMGVPTKVANITSGNRIFMPLFGKAKINLQQGPFAVIDGNGTDGSALFQLPVPDADGDGIMSYRVFARSLGKPGGSATVTTCATDPLTLEEVCSLETTVQVRTSGKSSFSDVSKGLLSISVDLDRDGVPERISLFDDRLQDYFWSYDNKGLRVLQLRFYPN